MLRPMTPSLLTRALKLALNFLSGTLDPRITFTRPDATSCATYFGSDGRSAVAAANVARFDYDPSTPAGTTGVAILQTPFGVPTGGYNNTITAQTATSFTSTGNTTTNRVYANTTATVPGNTYLFTGVMAAESGGGVVNIYARAGSLGAGNTITSTTISTGVPFTFYWTAQTTQDSILFVSSANGATYTVNNLAISEVVFTPKGLLLEESRTNLLKYCADATQTSVWTAGNINTAANALLSPDGSTDASSLTGSSSTSNNKQVGQAHSTSTTGTYTVSVYAKAGTQSAVLLRTNDNSGSNGCHQSFNLTTGALTGGVGLEGTATSGTSSITGVGNGWYRLSVTCTFVSALTNVQLCLWFDGYGASTSTGTFYVWNAQLEVGAFATSPIATTTATVTRAADSALMTGTNFSSWFNASQGSFVAKWNDFNVGSGSAMGFFSANDGTSQNKIDVRSTSTDVIQSYGSSGGAGSWAIGGSVVTPTSPGKAAMSYVTGSQALCVNGATVYSATSATIPAGITQLQIGGLDNNANLYKPNGHLRSLTYYNTALPAATLQTLST